MGWFSFFIGLFAGNSFGVVAFNRLLRINRNEMGKLHKTSQEKWPFVPNGLTIERISAILTI